MLNVTSKRPLLQEKIEEAMRERIEQESALVAALWERSKKSIIRNALGKKTIRTGREKKGGRQRGKESQVTLTILSLPNADSTYPHG